jgi:hypothetical protein
VKDQLIQVFEELKSARTIMELLQEDITKLNAAVSIYESKLVQHRESSARDQANKNWIPVLHNGHKKYKKPVVTTRKLNRQLVTLSNRFTPLASAQGTEVPNDTITYLLHGAESFLSS